MSAEGGEDGRERQGGEGRVACCSQGERGRYGVGSRTAQERRGGGGGRAGGEPPGGPGGEGLGLCVREARSKGGST